VPFVGLRYIYVNILSHVSRHVNILNVTVSNVHIKTCYHLTCLKWQLGLYYISRHVMRKRMPAFVINTLKYVNTKSCSKTYHGHIWFNLW